MVRESVDDLDQDDAYRERCFEDLTTAEGLLVWALRSWVSGYQHSACARAKLKEGFARARVPGGERLLNLLMPLIAAEALRSIEIRCPGCSDAVSRDEEIFLSAVGAAQMGEDVRKTSLLAEFVPPTALMPILCVIDQLAEALADAGLRMPGCTRPTPGFSTVELATAPGTIH